MRGDILDVGFANLASLARTEFLLIRRRESTSRRSGSRAIAVNCESMFPKPAGFEMNAGFIWSVPVVRQLTFMSESSLRRCRCAPNTRPEGIRAVTSSSLRPLASNKGRHCLGDAFFQAGRGEAEGPLEDAAVDDIVASPLIEHFVDLSNHGVEEASQT